MRRATASLLAAGAALTASAALTAWLTKKARKENRPIGRFLDVDGVRLHYVEIGSGEPVILLHGNGGMVQDFLASDLVRIAARSHRVILFDRPGYGWSSRPHGQRWTPAAQAELLATAARRLGAEQAHLFGHSWGALVALEWALRHPESVQSLTLASGYYFPSSGRAGSAVAAALARPGVVGKLLRFTMAPLAGRLAWPWILRQIFAPGAVPQSYVAFPRGLALSPRSLGAAAQEAAFLVPALHELEPRYGELKPAVSIIAGCDDPLVDSRAQSERLHGVVPGSRLILIEETGHMVHHAEPDRVAAALPQAA